MERWKAVLKKLLLPGKGWVALAVVLDGISLAAAFLVFGDSSPFAYVSYILSAYALTILVAAIMPLLFSAWRLAHSVPLAHRYLTDRYFKVRSGLRFPFLSICAMLGSSWPARCGYTSCTGCQKTDRSGI